MASLRAGLALAGRCRRAELGAKRLSATHRGPEMLARVAELPVEAAYDGLELEL